MFGASMPTAKVTNISGMSGITCSWHIFSSPNQLTKSNDKGKAREDVVEREKIGPVTNNDVIP